MIQTEHKMENPNLSQGHNYKYSCFDPEQCPICKRAIKAHFLYGYVNIEKKLMYTVFECMACHGVFIKKSTLEIQNGGPINIKIVESETALPLSSLAPNPPAPISFTKYISEISPKFVEIFNQANAAECASLDEIAGIGYRKSIEFLIKDYLMLPCETDEEKEAIKGKPLAQCISKDINNENLKIAASRAAWIGNDETHYIRKHTDKDITDLKRLIDLTVRWIEMECMTKEAEGIPYIK